jgi:hypothetical protein
MLSIDIDFSPIWNMVNQILPSLWVVFAVPLGVIFAFGLLDKIMGAVKGALGRGL